MSQSIRDKVIVVTGASSGIGRAMACLFAAEGARVALAARSTKKLEALAGELGADALPLTTDLAKPKDVDAMIETALAHFGRIDALMANAGVYFPGLLVEGDPDEWEQTLAVNVNSVIRAVHAVLPHMIRQGAGDIVVTSSIAGHKTIPLEPVYSASKHAIQAFVYAARRQLVAQNIRIGAIAPGTVLNELWGYSESAPQKVEERVAAHDGLRSEDIAEAALFMLTRPPHVTIRDIVILPQAQDI